MTLLLQVVRRAWKHGRLGMVMSLAILSCGICWGQAGTTVAQEKDEQAIRKAIASYVAAFNRQDAKAVASHWSPEAVYVTPVDGRRLTGREAIENQFKTVFENADGLNIEVVVEAIQFVSPNVAVEQGRATFRGAELEDRVTEYSAVHVRRDGVWLLDRVEEKVEEVSMSNYEHLKQLEWLVGTWIDQDETGRIETVCHWTKNQNFLHRAFAVFRSAGRSLVWDANHRLGCC